MFWQKRFHTLVEQMRGRISVHQILAVKSGTAALPLTREYMYSD